MRIYLHSELAASHTTHGIAHEDYAQYSEYCARKLKRLRHGKSVKRDLLHTRQYKSSVSTKVIVDATTGKEIPQSKAKHAYRAIEMNNLPSDMLTTHENYFLEPLYCAERCWSASMAVKVESSNGMLGGGGSGGTGSSGAFGSSSDSKKDWSRGKIRAHSIKKLRKAVKFATLLETLTHSTKAIPTEGETEEDGGDKEEQKTVAAQPPVDEHTQMEAKAYASWMRGNLALEQNHWQTACNEYQSALTYCESLASNVGGGGGDDTTKQDEDGKKNDLQQLELFDFFTTRAQNVISPLLRYCHYELQEKGMSPTEKISFLQSTTSSVSDTPNDPLQSKLHSLKAQNLQSQATSGSSMSQITFRENTIAVETKELRIALLKIQDLKTDWEEEKKNSNNNNNNNSNTSDAKFMELLNGYDDATALANQELKQLATLKSGPAVNAKKFQLTNIVGYCKYQKLRLVMGRNEGLANDIIRRNKKKGMTLKHFEEVAHLYDALLQDGRAVVSISGGGSPEDFDGSNTATVEDEFLLEANANILRLRALRCYYLAKMHASPHVNKYHEALALLDQAESLAQEASEEIGACDQMVGGDELLENLESVLEEMKGEKCRILAVSYMNKHTSSSTVADKCVLERLHDYTIPSALTPLVHVPPKLEPMACKPSFFDVAANFVSEYPTEELEQVLEDHGDGSSTSGGGQRKGLLGWFRS